MIGSLTLQIMFRVGCWVNGSANAVAASGTSSMSLSWICLNPRMLEPSNPTPSSKASTSNSFAETVKCCQSPGRSMNRRSIAGMPLSLINAITSFGVIRRPPIRLLVAKQPVLKSASCIRATLPPARAALLPGQILPVFSLVVPWTGAVRSSCLRRFSVRRWTSTAGWESVTPRPVRRCGCCGSPRPESRRLAHRRFRRFWPRT